MKSPQNANFNEMDHLFMSMAMEEAKVAFSEDEIPVGAVLTRNGEVVGKDHNRTRQTSNPLAHAEKLLIDKFIDDGNKYLDDCVLYVTLEPCLMCAGIMIWSRLGRLVFATADPKAGCVGSIYNALKDIHFNHHPEVHSGLMAEESGVLLREFFKSKR